ncbi:cryptochrome/photolyase family protein [Flammeovirga sp. MY04]|uniref:cryptochrome/photolyase family protein n=1 Tax=Flammeovirga sp. MY04 TaxID=1191459 RepID=UPI00080618E3|nr:cryptochrome/photolyase family protein [Flammeovirga sp. MY04]ANQ48676.1 cryptochrome/photolyase family protein [Flammeovirga sp. MY04]
MSKSAALIYPHQLFKHSPLFEKEVECFFIIEEPLFFGQYNFHKQKIAYHRATMKFYQDYLKSKNYKVTYLDYTFLIKNDVFKILQSEGYHQVVCLDVTDDWLSQKVIRACDTNTIQLEWMNSLLHINSKLDNEKYFKADKKKYYHSQFYKLQRTQLGILVDESNNPMGGQWSFDTENRKKYPAKKTPPSIKPVPKYTYWEEAYSYVEKQFKDNFGEIEKQPIYPITFDDSNFWLDDFLNVRFSEFGIYEDAIVASESFLNHSVLTPMLNIGLLTPHEILAKAKYKFEVDDIPLNSYEGFIRQIIGWREFIRGIYEANGRKERSTNFWKFDKKMPNSLYHGTTGLPPIDQTIKKIKEIAYCHHIERLMILGNFMLLCEIDPDEVYQWFMELFIDAYDWVMVTNIYGMSQFADGGLMASKPYISSSNYIIKMSNYKKGEWQLVWDGLFWRFMDKHRDFLKKNPRLSMLIKNYDKMDPDNKKKLMNHAEQFLLTHQLPQKTLFN